MSHSQLDLLSEIAPVRYSRRRKHGTTRYWETIDRKLPFDAPGCRVELLLALVKGVVSRKPRNFRQPINMACLALGR